MTGLGGFNAAFLQLILFCYLIIALPCEVSAHGTDYRILNGADTVAIECAYDDGEPMQYAEVLLYSPGDSQVEYQNGRTDKQGVFVFYPQSQGVWRMKVSDGMGHALQADIDVNLQNSTRSGEHAVAADQEHHLNKGSRLFRATLGISLIINIFWGISLWKSKRRQNTTDVA